MIDFLIKMLETFIGITIGCVLFTLVVGRQRVASTLRKLADILEK